MKNLEVYIALLRGINVSGQKKILMADLKKHMEELNFTNVSTYIQSGNIIFKTEKTTPEMLEQKISKMISEKFGFDVSVFVVTPAELERIIAQNPFQHYAGKEEEKTYFTFLSEAPASEENISRVDYAPEEFFINEKILYFYPPAGYGKAKLNNNIFEKKLKVTATTRNFKTVKKLLEICRGLEEKL